MHSKSQHNITINNIIAVSNIGSSEFKTEGEIIFLPPDPTIFIKADRVIDFQKIQIVLSAANNETKTMKVNFFRLVDIIN